MHALKVEDLKINKMKANLIVETLHDFLTDLGYGNDRISNLECRRRDGFSPYSHNKGGLAAVAFSSRQYVTGTGAYTGFPNADKTIEKYNDYDVELYEQEINKKYADWADQDLENFDEWNRDDGQDSILYSADLMLTSENELNIRLCVCVKDAPYHRQYDDLIDIDIEFKDIKELALKLQDVLKRDDVRCFENCLTEAY